MDRWLTLSELITVCAHGWWACINDMLYLIGTVDVNVNPSLGDVVCARDVEATLVSCGSF